MSSVGSRWRSREASRVSLPVAGSLARKSAGAAAMSRTWAPGNSARAASASCSPVSTSMRWTPGGLGQGDVGGDQGHVGPAAGGGGGEGDAHAAAGAVAEEANRVDRLAGAAGRDQDPEAVPGALAGRQLGFDPGEQAGRVGEAALAVLAARGQRALLGLDHGRRRARAASPGWPASPRRRTCGRSSPAPPGAARCRRGRRWSPSSRRLPAASFATVLAEAGATR